MIRYKTRKTLFGEGYHLLHGDRIVALFADIAPAGGIVAGSGGALASQVRRLLNEEEATAAELTRLRGIEERCRKHLDDCALEKVMGRPWQEVRP